MSLSGFGEPPDASGTFQDFPSNTGILVDNGRLGGEVRSGGESLFVV